jgi:peroxiredoxin
MSTGIALVGSEAPDFTLPATSGESVTLSSFRGRRHVLLAFFPAAFTSVCTSEMCAFSEDFDQLAVLGVEVLPISGDHTASLTEFRNKYAMRGHLLSDLKRTVCAAYGTLWKDAFVSNRVYILVDSTGVIRWRHDGEHPGKVLTSEEVRKAIKDCDLAAVA